MVLDYVVVSRWKSIKDFFRLVWGGLLGLATMGLQQRRHPTWIIRRVGSLAAWGYLIVCAWVAGPCCLASAVSFEEKTQTSEKTLF